MSAAGAKRESRDLHVAVNGMCAQFSLIRGALGGSQTPFPSLFFGDQKGPRPSTFLNGLGIYNAAKKTAAVEQTHPTLKVLSWVNERPSSRLKYPTPPPETIS